MTDAAKQRLRDKPSSPPRIQSGMVEIIENALRRFQLAATDGSFLDMTAHEAAETVASLFDHVGYWRYDISDQCQHCEPDRLYQTASHESGFYYDAEDEMDIPVFKLDGPDGPSDD